MTPEQQAAYINSQAACALIEMAGMQAANAANLLSPPYSQDDFNQILIKYGIFHNAVVGWFR
jgi:hypothetical protein